MTDAFSMFPTAALLVGGFMALIAIVAISHGTWVLLRSRRLARDGREAEGTVVESQMESRRRTGTGPGSNSSYVVFHPVVRFRTDMGQEVTAVGPAPSNRSFITGTAVRLRYDPDDPSRIEITSGPGKGTGGATGIAAGLVLLVVLAVIATATYLVTKDEDCPAPPGFGPGVSTGC